MKQKRDRLKIIYVNTIRAAIFAAILISPCADKFIAAGTASLPRASQHLASLASSDNLSIASCEAARAIRARAIRVAVIGFARAAEGRQSLAARALESKLQMSLARDERVALIEPSLFQPAIAGIGYDGSINLSKGEASRLGAAIGCDFFITGKAETLARSERERESHEEAIIGVMIVDGRVGSLAGFDFIAEKAATAEAALSAASNALDARAKTYVDKMSQFRDARDASIDASSTEREAAASIERVEDVPDENSPLAIGFKPPVLLNRVKPDYTAEAGRANISATVEAMAVFRASGEVGHVEIIRWAGFGLDEAAARAIAQLKFKPATRDGLPVSVRAMIRYNFRRVSESEAKPAESESKPETNERDLRQLFKPDYRRPPIN